MSYHFSYDKLPSEDVSVQEYEIEGEKGGMEPNHWLPRTRRKHCTGCLLCSAIWGLSVLAGVAVVYLLLAISGNLWGPRGGDPDKIFANWGKNGTGTEHLAWYPTDFLRDVIPVPCHSHNDYWRKVPVFSALHAGCVGIEADVWLFDNDANLYVGHDTAALQSSRTFRSLYIHPLLELIERNNPDTPFYNDTRRGIFDTDPEQTVVLLVDLKTDGAATYKEVQAQLEPLRERGWLTFVEDGVIHKRHITVVGTGNTPFDVLMLDTYRDIFFDAPVHRLNDASGLSLSPYNITNSFYASANFKIAVGTVLTGLSDHQVRVIRAQVQQAHELGLKVRYWNTPSWPIGLRNKIWRTLIAEGADILNVDDLASATRRTW
ncbi:hypothetical protein F5Y16DRAFT_398989 [Xylariaceae sp. FL0255]|nr:hypothetical protein F5Y16DRAFT_398989 [Xylariaceae sp. FL0255]